MRIEIDIDGNVTKHEDAPIVEQSKDDIEAQRKVDILTQISVIEAKQPRALREVALGMDGAIDRLKAIDDEISALRAQL